MKKHSLEVIKIPVSLNLANDGKAIASSVCKVPLSAQSYSAVVDCHTKATHRAAFVHQWSPSMRLHSVFIGNT